MCRVGEGESGRIGKRSEGPGKSSPVLPDMRLYRIVEKFTIRVDAPPTSNK